MFAHWCGSIRLSSLQFFHLANLFIMFLFISLNIMPVHFSLIIGLCSYIHVFFMLSMFVCLSYWLVTLFIAHHWLFLICSPLRASDGYSIMPCRVFSNRGYIWDALFIPFWYIGWKPGCKFRSRIRMDGSAVCTRDTTPRSEIGSKCGFAFLPCLIKFFYCLVNFITVYLNCVIFII